MTSRVVDLGEKLSQFSELWSPKVVARLNDHEVKVVKLGGEFVWHKHDETDELFFVVAGELTIQCVMTMSFCVLASCLWCLAVSSTVPALTVRCTSF